MRNPWTGEEDGSGGNPSTSGVSSKLEEPWAALSERTLVALVEQLFSHLLKLLNICAHVLDDTLPGPAAKVTFWSILHLNEMFWCPVCGAESLFNLSLQIQATLPSLSNAPSLSPIRRKGKEKEAEPNSAPLSPKKANDINTGACTHKHTQIIILLSLDCKPTWNY